MAKYVRISTVAAAPPTAPPAPPRQLVEQMLRFWEGKLGQVWPDQPDLVVLPEMCDRYAHYSPTEASEFRRELGDQLLHYVCEQAARHRCYIAYPALRQIEDGTSRNSVRLIDRSGQTCGLYDKNHIVVSETDDSGVVCGSEAPLFECDFGSVACAVCFDLNFDQLRLKYKAAKPDIILFSSMYHGGLMQAYWAYSCRAHFVGCVSDTATPSAILSPLGHQLASTTNYTDFVTAGINLDCCLAHLDFNAEKLRALKEAYGAQAAILDPGQLGAVLITSESPERSATEMAAEFGIELLDDYMARSLAHRSTQCGSASTLVELMS